MRTIRSIVYSVIAALALLPVSITYNLPAEAAILIKSNCSDNSSHEECEKGENIEYIYLYDEIDYDTYRLFVKIATTISVNQPFPKVYLNSRGGNPDHGRQIGRLLRLRNATVEERDMIYPDHEPHCSSACVDIAAGAVIRNLAQIEIHKGHVLKRIKGEKYEVKPMPDIYVQQLKDYFTEMGIDNEISRLLDTTNDKNEWVIIKYNNSRPLNEQLIYKLGFLMNEAVAQDLSKLYGERKIDDWSASIAFEKLANNGDKQASYILGHRYLNGLLDLPKDSTRAIEWFKKSGDLGNAFAFHALGFIYDDHADIVAPDPEASTRYYKKAAELGFAGSQNNLAWSYYKGKGVKKNTPEAIYWATRSAEQGEPFAYSTLAQIRFEGNGFTESDVETLKWAILAVDGLPNGQSREELKQIKSILEGRMSEADRRDAHKQASEWKPLKDGGRTMRDRDDE